MAQGHAMVGWVFTQQNRLEAARDEFRRGLDLDPSLGGARTGLGAALYKLGFVSDALRELRQAVQQDPTSAQARYQLGLALFAGGALEEAKSEFERSVKLAPDLVEARINLGQLLENANTMT